MFVFATECVSSGHHLQVAVSIGVCAIHGWCKGQPGYVLALMMNNFFSQFNPSVMILRLIGTWA